MATTCGVFPMMGTFVAVDTETTGFSFSKGAEVIELSAVKVQNGQIVDTFSTLIRPENGINEEAAKVNHITEAMVAIAPTMQTVFPQFLKFIGNNTLVMHNAAFDLAFLNGYYEKFCGQPYMPNSFICTLEMSRELIPAEKHTLAHMVKYFNIAGTNTHRATDDADCAAYLLLKLAERLAEKQNTVMAAGYVHTNTRFTSYAAKMRDYKKTQMSAAHTGAEKRNAAVLNKATVWGTIPTLEQTLKNTMSINVNLNWVNKGNNAVCPALAFNANPAAVAREDSSSDIIMELKWYMYDDETQRTNVPNKLASMHDTLFVAWNGERSFKMRHASGPYFNVTVQKFNGAYAQAIDKPTVNACIMTEIIKQHVFPDGMSSIPNGLGHNISGTMSFATTLTQNSFLVKTSNGVPYVVFVQETGA